MIFRSSLDPALRAGFQQVSDAEMARDPEATPPPIDFQPLVAAGHQVLDWLLDVARAHTTDPADVESIDRVRAAGRAPACHRASEQDLLVVAGILLMVFEAELGVVGLAPIVGALYDVAEPLVDKLIRATRAAGPTAARAALRLPVIVRRRRPRVAHGADALDAEAVGTVLIIG